MQFDQAINQSFAPVSEAFFSVILYSVSVYGQDVPLLVAALALAGVGLTLYLGFINVRLFGHAVDIVRGKYDKPADRGQISSWQALMTSMSGTVGLGNIAGVAVAVSLGGPGAVLWMVILGFFSMSTKCVEVTLALKHRRLNETSEGDAALAGGPMYYLRAAFDRYRIPYVGRVFAVFFAVCCVLGSLGGAVIFQANQAFEQVYVVTGGDAGFWAGKGWLFGLGLAVLVGVVVIGGIRSIASVASRLVPVMAVIYMVAAVYVIGLNIADLPDVLSSIWRGAFNLEAGVGGVLGVMLIGFQRAAFSNEAGLGTASIVYCAARASDPVRQGIASMLGPFLDTVVICTVTALLILMSGVYEPGQSIEGIALTSRALEQGGAWMPYLLAVIVFLFAYSTMIGFSYVSGKAFAYLAGERPFPMRTFQLVYCLSAVVGCSAQLGHVISFTDAVFLSMAIPNLIGVLLLAPCVKADVRAYRRRMKL